MRRAIIQWSEKAKGRKAQDNISSWSKNADGICDQEEEGILVYLVDLCQPKIVDGLEGEEHHLEARTFSRENGMDGKRGELGEGNL